MSPIKALEIVERAIQESRRVMIGRGEDTPDKTIADRALDSINERLNEAFDAIANITDEPLDEAIARGAIKPRDW